MKEFSIFLWFAVIEAVAAVEKLNFLKDFLDSVHRERSISTLLLMQRKCHKNPTSLDHLQQLYPLSWPTIRLDETQRIQLVNFHNRDALALVYMDAPEDSSLLSALAANFNHMREARIIIWLQVTASTKLLEIIEQQAAEHKFLSLLIIENAERFFRLYPFPQPNLQELHKPFEGKLIFPSMRRNFMGKIAVTLPDLVPPRSYMYTDPRTGGQRYGGHVYKLIRNFALRHNVTLQTLERPLMGNKTLPVWKIMESTVRGELDLPMTGQLISFRHPKLSKIDALLGMSALSIVVPCGTELPLGDRFYLVYGMSLSYMFIGSYILLSAVEVILRRFCDMIKKKPYTLDYLGIVLNLRMIRCLLGMSIPWGNRLRSVKGLLIVVMSFLGVINSSITNAQYSTLLTMCPQYKHILNFQQLRESNLTVAFNYLNLKRIKEEMDHEFLKKTLPNVIVVGSAEQLQMMTSLNTKYAYQIYSYNNDPFSVLQERSYRKALCRSPELDIVTGLSYSSVLQENSVYALALREFAFYAWSAGLMPHWVNSGIREYFFRSQVNRLPAQAGGSPLKLQDYNISWHLLFVGQALACCAFIAEVLIGWRRRRGTRINQLAE